MGYVSVNQTYTYIIMCIFVLMKEKIIKPLEGSQYEAIRSNANFVVMTGAGGGGKTRALCHKPIYYLTHNPGAKAIWFMRNVGDFWDAGRVADELKKIYPLLDRKYKITPKHHIGEIIRGQEDMGVKLYNNSEIKFQQLNLEDAETIDKLFKGIQTKLVIFEECNKFKWETISSIQTRLRASTKGTAQILLAQNPERECFIRQLCGSGENGGGWIDDNGNPIPEMNGNLKYFHIVKGNLNQVYWGNTKREVYSKCKEIIDGYLKNEPDMTYEDFMLSMNFFTFDVRDNKAMLSENKDYRMLTATSVLSDSMYKSNWNFSITDTTNEDDELENIDISEEDIKRMFTKSYRNILDKERITIDVATTGLDNLVMKHWNGFHCDDIEYCEKNSNFQMVRMIKTFMAKHHCTDSNLIIDIQGNGYLKEIFNLNNGTNSGYGFSGATSATSRSKRQFERFKDESAHLAMQMIKAGLITYDPSLANKVYRHQRLKRMGATTIQKQLLFERRIWQFRKTPTGKIQFLGKIQQHSDMKGFSPDLSDNIIMLCGGLCHDCYRALAQITGEERKKINDKDLLDFFKQDDTDTRKSKIKINSDKILNILSVI